MGTSHLLLTRFSVRLSDRPPPSDGWLRARLDLFRRYTVPSVASQRLPPDAWLVLCSSSPSWLLDELMTIRQDVPVLTPVQHDGVFSPQTVRTLVRRYLPPDAERVITTRLDNDDAIARDYLKAIEGAARSHDGFLNFTHGLQLEEGCLYRRSDPLNAFVSLVEPVERLRTVFVDQHHLLDKHGPVTQIRQPGLWLQVIHGHNIANAAHGIRANPANIIAMYGPDLGTRPVSSPALLCDQISTVCRLAVRVVGRPHRIRWALRVLLRK